MGTRLGDSSKPRGIVAVDESTEESINNLLDFYKSKGQDYNTAMQSIIDGTDEQLKWPTKDNGFFTPKYKYVDGKKVQAGETPSFAEYGQYMKNFYKTKANDEACYYWNGKFYEVATKLHLDSLCMKNTKNKAQPSQYQHFRRELQVASFVELHKLIAPPMRVNFNNGTLNIKTKELKPHDSKHFFKHALACDYDPSARCPNFLKFLDFVFGEGSELSDLTFEIFGYCLMGGDPIAHKAFLLFGGGRNGKSTWLDTLREVLGTVNTAAVSMKLLGKPFSMVQLDGKLANIVEESPTEIDPEDFKNIVGGGMVTASHKGKPEYQLKINSRLLFGSNKLPKFNDATHGIKERLMIIPFNKFIEEGERDTGIKDKLKAEVPGIINMSLRALEKFLGRGGKFLKTEEVTNALIEYIQESDSVIQWSKESLEWSGASDTFVETSKIYVSYDEYCIKFNLKPVGINEFRRRIKNVYRNMYISHGLKFDDSLTGRMNIAGSPRRGAKFIYLSPSD